MNKHNGPKTTYFALSFQFLLEDLIIRATRDVAKEIIIKTDMSGIAATPKVIFLRETHEDTLITYQTAIALNLSHQWNKPVKDVAEHIAQQMKRIAHNARTHNATTGSQTGAQTFVSADLREWPFSMVTAAIASTFALSIHSKGYIQCHLSATTINLWLQEMVHVNHYRASGHRVDPNRFSKRDHHGTNASPQPSSSSISGVRHQTPTSRWTISDIPFSIFHTHARCCAILRLAHTAGQITLQTGLDDGNEIRHCGSEIIVPVLRPPWTMIQPTALPWKMILSPQGYPQNWAIAQPLLAQIITSFDRLTSLTSQASDQSQKRKNHEEKRLKEIMALSTAIQQFDAEVPLNLPYLGLIFIAQGLLNALLSEFLDHVNIERIIPDEL